MYKSTISTTLPDTYTGKIISKHIYDIYNKYYNASISTNVDMFIYIKNYNFICSAFGIKFAKHEKLFSEYYLNKNIEEFIGVSRKHIVEVCNCVSLRPGYGGKLYKLLASILDYLNINYALVTLTDAVQKIFNKLSLKINYLCDADISKINYKNQWGNFYETNPKTFILDVKLSVHNKDNFHELSKRMKINVAEPLSRSRRSCCEK